VLPLDSGGCGACAQQIYGLLAERYAADLRAHGVSFARSPRHADIVLVTGALSAAAREPVRQLLAGVPQPRALIAVGNCAIGGCVFRGSPHLVPDGAETLDVNVEIGGCPPAPHAILEAILEASQLLAAEAQSGTRDGRDPHAVADAEPEGEGAGAARAAED
jgi:Ni,Fe-hydrogenase III small subunit